MSRLRGRPDFIEEEWVSPQLFYVPVPYSHLSVITLWLINLVSSATLEKRRQQGWPILRGWQSCWRWQLWRSVLSQGSVYFLCIKMSEESSGKEISLWTTPILPPIYTHESYRSTGENVEILHNIVEILHKVMENLQKSMEILQDCW
jgi:hypothetical protein